VRLYKADAAVRFYEPASQAECFIGKKARSLTSRDMMPYKATRECKQRGDVPIQPQSINMSLPLVVIGKRMHECRHACDSHRRSKHGWIPRYMAKVTRLLVKVRGRVRREPKILRWRML
jgi:hypothetical protein